MKILVFAAHPDDEVLGAGGAIAYHVAKGDSVVVCIITKAYEPQWSKAYIDEKIEEQRKVDQVLGISERICLDLPTVKLNIIPTREFNQKISEVVEKVEPNIIYTHYEHDLNDDHSLIYRATLVAARPPKRIKLLCYEVLSETEWGTQPFVPNVYVDISDFIGKKIKAFEVYQSEVKEFPHPRSSKGIEVLSQKRGTEVCLSHAESFMLVRSFEV